MMILIDHMSFGKDDRSSFRTLDFESFEMYADDSNKFGFWRKSNGESDYVIHNVPYNVGSAICMLCTQAFYNPDADIVFLTVSKEEILFQTMKWSQERKDVVEEDESTRRMWSLQPETEDDPYDENHRVKFKTQDELLKYIRGEGENI